MESAVVRRPINAKPGLNFNVCFFSFCSKGKVIIAGEKNKIEFASNAFLPEYRLKGGFSKGSWLR